MALPGPSSGEHALIALSAGDDGAVMLPEGISYANADFIVSGDDLVLAAADGAQLVIEGYFDAVPPPDLVTAEGSQMAGQMVAVLAHPADETEVAQATPAPLEAHPVGHVENVAGTVTAIHADGTRVDLASGDPVFNGDTIDVGHAGAAGIVLADNSTLSMAEGARTVLDDVIYDASTGEGYIKLSVDAGNVVVAAGTIAENDPDAMIVSTPMTDVTVRDAQLGISVPDSGPERFVVMELADGVVGEVEIRTHDGGQEVLNYPNQGLFVLTPDSPPTQPQVFALDDVIHSFSGALSAVPEGVGTANDFGVGHDHSGLGGLGEEPAVESTPFDDGGGGDLAGATPPGDVGNFETAAGGGTEGGASDLIHVAGDGSTLNLVEPVATQPGSFSVAPAETTPATTDQEPPPPVPSGPNVIQGSGGPDVLTGSAGPDSIIGGAGNDTIDGRAGNDTIDGGAGDDLLRGGLGDDRIFGGGGDDAIVFSPGDGNDTVVDFGLGDQLTFENAIAGNVDVQVSGDDLIISVTNGGGDEVNNVTVKDGASYSVTETQTGDDVVIAVDPNAHHGG